MVSLFCLWLPILLSAIAVFIVSSIIHMFLGYHSKDFDKLENEDQVMDDLSKHNIKPGSYVMPYASSVKAMGSEDYKTKAEKGPVGHMTVLPNGIQNMGTSLLLWFLFALLVSFCAAYIASRALPPAACYLSVIRFVGASAFMGYSLALLQNSIWYKRKWRGTLLSMLDGLIYAIITGLIFAWLWPQI